MQKFPPGRNLPISLTIEGAGPDMPDFGMVQLTATYEQSKQELPPVEPEQVLIDVNAICALFDDMDFDSWLNIVEEAPQDSPIKKCSNPLGSTRYFLIDVLKALRHHYTNCLVAV